MEQKIKKIQGLDLMRALAITWVVMLHASESFHNVPPFILKICSTGWIGVDIFFVLSGFLIAGQVFQSKDEGFWIFLNNFWVKRWFRTLPLYFAVLFIYAVVKPFFGFPFVGGNWSFTVFLQNYIGMDDFVQSWSLCIEEQFYIGFPIIFFIFHRAKLRNLIWPSLLIVGIIYRIVLYKSGSIGIRNHPIDVDYNLRFLTHLHLDGIIVGVILAATKKHWIKLSKRIKTVIGIVGGIAGFSLPFITNYGLQGFYSVFTFTALAIFFGMMLIGLYELQIPNKVYHPINLMAQYSYGIYIFNSLVKRAFHHVEVFNVWYLNFALFFTVSIIVQIPTYYFLELPFLKLRKSFLR